MARAVLACAVVATAFVTHRPIAAPARRAARRQCVTAKHAFSEPHPGKAGILISKWKSAAENLIALGFLPDHTHPGRAGDLRRVRACAHPLLQQ